jgi:hypothetical protein
VSNSNTGTALSRILGGNGTSQDYLSLLGNVAGTGLGIAGSLDQQRAQDALSQQLLGYGAPSRGRYEASMTPGFDPNSIPGYSAAVDNSMQAMLRKLSAQGGNPFGNPGGLIEANKAVLAGTALPAIQNYQNQNAASGGLSALTGAAPGSLQGGVNSGANLYNAIGSGVANITNPQPSITDILRLLQQQQVAQGAH